MSRLGATATFTPFDLAAIRFAVSGAIALLLFLRYASWHLWHSYAVMKIGTGEASMRLALVSAFSAIGGLLILGEQLGLRSIAGILVVSVGAMLGALPPGALSRILGFRSR